MSQKKLFRYLFYVCIWAVVGWGVVRAIQKSTEQLADQREQLSQQATLMDQQADQADATRSIPNDSSNRISTSEIDSLRSKANQLRQQSDQFWKADWRYLCLAGLVYSLGMIPTARYWLLCLEAMGQQVPWRHSVWAYFYGNLGKYVPGKAMVVVLRVAELSKFGTQKVATTITIFMETLSTMAVGGAVAAICVFLLDLDWRISLMSLGLLAATAIPTAPNLLRLILKKLQPGIAEETLDQWTQRLNWRLTFKGWGILCFTWLGYGLSLGCVLYGLPSTQWLAESASQFWLSVFAACALAVVVGFVSMMPGGAGVREVVLATVLSPVVGPTAALSCAIWLRVTWLFAELVMAGLSYLLKNLGSSEPKTT
ncbi:MAG: lysylphosphatidylglycerol synthase transmembrane domain-containing protein [Pirellulales bacterium]